MSYKTVKQMRELTPTHLALFRMVRGWGGTVVALEGIKDFHNLKSNENFDECPFAAGQCGINWKAKTLYYNASDVPNVGVFIHESGHLFASKVKPQNSEEIDWIGWEYMLAHQLGCVDAWEECSKDYTLGELRDYDIEVAFNPSRRWWGWADYGDFKKHHAGHKTAFWNNRLEFARKKGTVYNCKAVAIR